MTVWLEGLSEIVLGSAFANALGVKPNGLERMAGEKTLPWPRAKRGRQPVWFEEDVVEWFSHLQPEQSAYASVRPELGRKDLERGYYACPARDSGYIGNRRPKYLALYFSGEQRNADGYYEVPVFPVRWVQTEQGVMGETIAVPQGMDPSQVTPIDVRQWRTDPELLTTFVLDLAAERTLYLRRGNYRGGTISTESLEAAMVTGVADHFEGGYVHLEQ